MGVNHSTRIPQPIPYQGSKRRIAPIILRYLPTHISRLVEPFAGSAALSIAAAARNRVDCMWVNDGHSPLIQLWWEIINSPEDLASRYSHLWNDQLGQEREYFDMVRNRFNEQHEPVDFLYLLARCVKAAIRYNANGEFNNTPDNRRRGAHPSEMRSRLARASELLHGRTMLTSWDYKQVFEDCTEDDVVYMDPPYQGVCGTRDQRYLPKVDHDEFCNELASLNDKNVMFALSYDGRTETKTYGKTMPDTLRLTHLEVCAGRSTQATLLGRTDITYESLYLSPALVSAIESSTSSDESKQLALL